MVNTNIRSYCKWKTYHICIERGYLVFYSFIFLKIRISHTNCIYMYLCCVLKYLSYAYLVAFQVGEAGEHGESPREQ